MCFNGCETVELILYLLKRNISLIQNLSMTNSPPRRRPLQPLSPRARLVLPRSPRLVGYLPIPRSGISLLT